MKCKSIQKRLSAYIDGELGEDLAGEISRHLETCPYCGKELARLRQLYGFIDIDVSMTDDPHFVTRVRAGLQKRDQAHLNVGKLEWWIGRLLIPATLVVGLFIGTIIGKQVSRGLLPSSSANFEMSRDYIDRDVFSAVPSGSLVDNFLALNKKDE